MALKLNLEQQQELEAVLLGAFDLQRFRRMLRLFLGYRLDEEMSTDHGFRSTVSDLIDRADRDGWVENLLTGARQGNPDNSALSEYVKKMGIESIRRLTKETIPVAGGLLTLEKIVSKRSPFISFENFSRKLSGLGSQICRIEIPAGTARGTGWLVGSDLILTAYHVVEDVHKSLNGLNERDICCRFDFSNSADGSILKDGRTMGVDNNWLLASSHYSDADLRVSQNDPGFDELDFALVRLKGPVGDDELSVNSKRGFIEVPENPPVMSQQDFMIIPQHPDGRSLELAFGEILSYNAAANRVRYDANTEGGSSGSPCFSIGLIPFALHHASGPTSALKYNQGVPLREIIRQMKNNNQIPFWKEN